MDFLFWLTLLGAVLSILGVAYSIVLTLKTSTRKKETHHPTLSIDHHPSLIEVNTKLVEGFAHDMKNILAMLTGYTVLLRNDSSYGKKHTLIDQIEEGILRGDELIRMVSSSLNESKVGITTIKVKELIFDVKETIKISFPEIVIIADVGPEISSIQGNITQVRQFLLSTCEDVLKKMTKDGMLNIKAKNVIKKQEFIDQSSEYNSENYVEISVFGPNPEDFVRSIERKGIGSGLGMRLPITDETTGTYFGFKEIKTGLGLDGRTTVITKIYLPIAKSRLTNPGLSQLNSSVPQNDFIVVVVDDDENFNRDLTETLLKMYSYQVISAPHFSEAISKAKNDLSRVFLLLSDADNLTKANLVQLRKIQATNPSLKLMVYSTREDNIPTNIDPAEKLGFLHSSNDLIEAVKEILDKG